jgi:VIT family
MESDGRDSKEYKEASSQAGNGTNLSATNSIAMPHGPPHNEHHSGHGDFIRDAIIGFADGLTVPFALTAGLSA